MRPWVACSWGSLETVIQQAEELAVAHGDYSVAVMAALVDEEDAVEELLDAMGDTDH
jgi:hypothetical protein